MLDIPCGGAYLHNYLQCVPEIISIDSSVSFVNFAEMEVLLCEVTDIPLQDNRADKIYSLAKHQLVRIFPLIELGLNKKKMINTLPPELLKMTWSCRRPIYTKEGASRSCGKCHPCQEINFI